MFDVAIENFRRTLYRFDIKLKVNLLFPKIISRDIETV